MTTSTTDTYVLLRAFFDELARCGMRMACTSPGSRCAPLVLTLAKEQRLRCYSHVDERCAGFFALGAAKASGLPVAVTCTSGTAAAELLPAAIEAYEARVPLLLLTADRPPELRENGAGQAIDQLKLYGAAAKWFFEVGVPDRASPERLRWIRTLACRAYWTALEGRPGAVHLNFPLREPLTTDEELPADGTGRPGGAPYVLRSSSAPPAARARAYAHAADHTPPSGSALAAEASGGRIGVADGPLAELVACARRGVVVVGRDERWPIRGCELSECLPDRPALGAAVTAFCERVGWPLLADPMSGARRGPAAIAHYDAILRESRFAASHRPDLVLRAGDLPVSKPLRAWLSDLDDDVLQVAIDPEQAWQDPAAVLSHSLALDPTVTFTALAAATATGPSELDWLAAWRGADELAAEAIAGALPSDAVSEPALARELGVLLPGEATLWVASSMPVRDIETFWPARPDPPRVLCNRGANGIDGTVSSAFGAAASGDGPVVLLIGDVAFAYDIGGLLAASRLGLSLTIVLVDNDGGGIFDFLALARAPMAQEGDLYRTHVTTPTGLDPAKAAALYGLGYESASTIPAVRGALERALASRTGSTIVHVRTDRPENVQLHDQVWRAVSSSLAGAGGSGPDVV
jgi:2-succinyl-5-enolpyruvyl-6-hydroxy-3-cyclohexene-1-carboxylate synthase